MNTTSPNNTDIRLVSTATLAKRYDVSVRQIQLWTTAGILPVVKLGRRCVRYPVTECDTAMDAFKTRASALHGRRRG